MKLERELQTSHRSATTRQLGASAELDAIGEGSIYAALAEKERRMISERTRAGYGGVKAGGGSIPSIEPADRHGSAAVETVERFSVATKPQTTKAMTRAPVTPMITLSRPPSSSRSERRRR